MARIASQAFQEFIQTYEPTPYQENVISQHHNYIRKVLANKINIIEDFLTGSYVKKTQIKPPTDIDLFIVIDSQYAQRYYPKNASKLLSDFKKLIQVTYSSSLLKADGQAVVIQFSDGIKMDIVPAFQRNGGGYLIPNANMNTFISTGPKEYNDLLSRANQSMGGKLKPIIKMLKCWNVTCCKLLKSLHIEVLSLNCFCNLYKGECYPYESYQEGLEKFFSITKSSIKNLSYEPIVQDRVDRYLDDYVTINHQSYKKRNISAYLLEECHQKILQAIKFQKLNYHKEAIEAWKGLFSEYFPSYY